jgi:hypothetical protein
VRAQTAPLLARQKGRVFVANAMDGAVVTMEQVGGRTLRTATWRLDMPSDHLPVLFFNGIGANIEAVAPLAAALPERGFNMFDMPCGYDRVHVYEGVDMTGNVLHKRCTATGSGYTPNGFTGGPSYAGCYGSPCLPYTTQNFANGTAKTVDTLKAKNKMYVHRLIPRQRAKGSNIGRGLQVMPQLRRAQFGQRMIHHHTAA